MLTSNLKVLIGFDRVIARLSWVDLHLCCGIKMVVRRIGPDGSVVKDGEDTSSSTGGSSSSRGIRRWCCSLPNRIDVFGFHLQPKHFALLLLFISITMGSIGMAIFVFCLGMYNYYQRQSSSSPSSSGDSSRWKDGKVIGGANIKVR